MTLKVKHRILGVVLATSAFLFAFIAFQTRDDKRQYLVVGENNNHTTPTLRITQILLVDLREQPNTAYGWQPITLDTSFWKVDTIGDTQAASLRKSGVLPEHAEPKRRFGGAEWHVFRLVPQKAGTTRVEFDYARPWETENPAKRFIFTVTID